MRIARVFRLSCPWVVAGALAAVAVGAPGGASAASPGVSALVLVRVAARMSAVSRLAPLVSLANVSMATSRLGWAMVGTGSTRELAETVDGGHTWRLALAAPQPVDALATPNATHILVLEHACPGGVCHTDLVERLNAAAGSSWRTLWRGGQGGAAALSFPNARVGYVLAWRPLAPAPARLTLSSTTDGGRSWRRRVLSLPTPYRRGFTEAAVVSFSSRRDGWMLLGSQPGVGEQEKALFATTDAGAHWRLVAHTSPMGMPGRTGDSLPIAGYVQSLTLRPDGTGYIGLARGGLLVSHDGGRTFAEAYAGEVAPGSDFGATVGFLSSGFGWLYTGFSRPLYVSADGGRDWRPVYPPEWPFDLEALPGGAVAGAVTASNPRTVVGTGGFGAPWSAPPSQAPGPISAFQATGPGELTVAYDAGSRLAVSEDSGQSWERLPVPSGLTVQSLALSGTAIGWLLCYQPTALGPSASLFARSLRGGPVRWRRLRTPFVPTAAAALVGPGERSGLALGSRGAAPSALWWTGDGGARWQILRFPDAAALTGVGSESTVAWAFGQRRIYLTADAGVTWTEIDLPPALSAAQVSFGDARHGLVVTATGAVWSTADGGRIWRERFPGWPWDAP